jgi:hypothetical protein
MRIMQSFAPIVLIAVGLSAAVSPKFAVAEWKSHTVRQCNGREAAIPLPAKLQIITESLNKSGSVPSLVYMPEKNRLLLLINCDTPLVSSDDRGLTWSKPRPLHVNEKGQSDIGLTTGLTYLGNGKLMAVDAAKRWTSNDYGETWAAIPNPPASNKAVWYEWDPAMVDRDPATGKASRLLSFCSDNLQPDGHFQGYVRFSSDEGRTWRDEIKVPEWYAVNEAAFLRTKNGDILAACRTDNPDRFKGEIDHYGGLGVSISKDNGKTWSKVSLLYEWGRHHPSLVLMPNGEIVMSYVVRKGYSLTRDGFPQFGIEAVVSRDNGLTWDLDHRYLLHVWPGNRKGPDENRPGPQPWWASCQSTSTALLPDGTMLTAFGTGYRTKVGPNNQCLQRDVGLVLWRLGNRPTNDDRTLRDAPAGSETRNMFDPQKMLPARR